MLLESMVGELGTSLLIHATTYLARRIVEIAKEHNAIIVLEDLNKLRINANGSRKFNKKLMLWAYHRIQSYIYYKALIEGLHVVQVNPKGTSKVPPMSGRPVFINYRWVKLPNGVITTRDIVASWNLTLRGLKFLTQDVGSRGFVEIPNAPTRCRPKKG